jgi:Lar family restriction alleviation protein
MFNEPQMTDLPAEKQAAKAIQHTLARISEQPTVAYHCGYGTQTYALLTEAHATLHGITMEEAQENYPPAQARELEPDERRQCPFCGEHSVEIQNPPHEYSSEHRCHCPSCDALGGRGETPDEAVEKWNARAVQRL